MKPSITAPATTRTVAKLAASISSWRNASRHNKELAANATIARVVSSTALVAIDRAFRGGVGSTLLSIE